MRVIGGIFITIILTFSCSTQKVAIKVSNNDAMLIEPILVANLPEQLEKFKKKELLLINHNDTIIEMAYEFVVPKSYHSYSSVLNSVPTVHTFNYSSNQRIIVLFNTLSKESRALTNLDKESFEVQLNNTEVARVIKWELNNNDIDLNEERIYGIIEKDSIVYFAVNFISNSKETIALKKVY